MAREWTLLSNISWTSMDHLGHDMARYNIALGLENLQLSGSKEFQMCNQVSDTTQESKHVFTNRFNEMSLIGTHVFIHVKLQYIYIYIVTNSHI